MLNISSSPWGSKVKFLLCHLIEKLWLLFFVSICDLEVILFQSYEDFRRPVLFWPFLYTRYDIISNQLFANSLNFRKVTIFQYFIENLVQLVTAPS